MSIFSRGSVGVVLNSVRFFLNSLASQISRCHRRAPRVDAQASDKRTGIEGCVLVSMVFQTDGITVVDQRAHSPRVALGLLKISTIEALAVLISVNVLYRDSPEDCKNTYTGAAHLDR